MFDRSVALQRLTVPAGIVLGLVLGTAAFVFRASILHGLDAVSPALTALATLCIAYFTYTLFQATQALKRGGDETLAHLMNSAQHELRAYVGVTPNDLAVVPSVGEAFTATVGVRNEGKTPAYDLEVLVGWLFDSEPSHYAAPFGLEPLRRTHGSVLDPGTGQTKKLVVPPVTQEQADGIRTSVPDSPDAPRFWLLGWVLYNDAFGVERKRQFCVRYGANATGLPQAARYCPIHNREIL
jgi:hypothetical protein